MDLEQQKKALDDKIWRTKGARFNAHRRLARKQNLVVFVTSASSIHLISISIFQIAGFICLSDFQDSMMSLISIIVSIVILVYGLIEGGKNYGLLSEVNHRCGIDIDRVYKNIYGKTTQDEVNKLSDDYDNLLEKYSTNHDVIDDQYFMSCHPDVFKKTGHLERLYTKFLYKFKDIIFALFFVLFPIIISISILLL